ncbi:hypothetical protein GOBAR_DD29938 [Gossypium barbadense]|nr:hypothetical protein GOBAR_DD29938 [Gossypium barbadense]
MARQIVVLALVTMALFALVSTAAAAPAPAPGASPSGSPGDASSPPSQASAPSPSSGAALEISAIVGVGAAAVAGYFMIEKTEVVMVLIGRSSLGRDGKPMAEMGEYGEKAAFHGESNDSLVYVGCRRVIGDVTGGPFDET